MADLVLATSPALRENARLFRRLATIYPTSPISNILRRQRQPAALPPDLAAIAQPRLGYAGALSDFKVDFPLLLNLAENQPGWQFVLIGEERAGQRDPTLRRLRGRANVHMLGWRDYRTLPDYFRGPRSWPPPAGGQFLYASDLSR